jgi:phosphotransferase system enzyme I (PtsI)
VARTESEANPFLGFRAIRICLESPDFFKKQLPRRPARASALGNVQIM